MTDREKIVQAVSAAVQDINQTLPPDHRMDMAPDAPLYGPRGVVDSLTLTLLVVAVEQKVEAVLGRSVTLMGSAPDNGDGGPFRSIDALADHITGLLC